jgi:hypothetical protein
MLVISCILAYVYVGILRSAERIGSPYFHGLGLSSEPHGLRIMGQTVVGPNEEPHSAMHPEMRYQQQMHLKEDRWSSPSADFHAATGKALTSGYRLFVSLYTT